MPGRLLLLSMQRGFLSLILQECPYLPFTPPNDVDTLCYSNASLLYLHHHLQSQPLPHTGRHSLLGSSHLSRVRRRNRIQVSTVRISFQNDHRRALTHILLHSHRPPRVHTTMRVKHICCCGRHSIMVPVRSVDFILRIDRIKAKGRNTLKITNKLNNK